MVTIAVPAFELDTDTPVVLRVAVVVEGLDASGDYWAQIYTPDMDPHSALDLFRQGCALAREDMAAAGDG